tara:strand:+ start:737 stop:1417 length:681 start_codon:yes stop_codon:yes gene_type:complete
MPTADSFTALGKGNGFPFCLDHLDLADNEIILNAPDLKETMKSYWNIDKLSFGGAEWDPTNSPKNLICDPNANQGSDTFETYSNTGGEVFQCTLGKPYKVKDVDNDEIYYAHGITFSYFRFEVRQVGPPATTGAEVSTTYKSTKYINQSVPYNCEPFYYTTSPALPPTLAGQLASKTSQTTSAVTIGGIPFIKTIVQSWNELQDSCPSVDFINPTTIQPSISFHTY